MIEHLTIGVPKELRDRSYINQESLAKFEKVTGIYKTRRSELSTLEMICKTLDSAMIPRNVGGVIVVTQSPHRSSPCLAVSVHEHLGLNAWVPAFDVNHACDGYILGLYLARRLAMSIILICADRLRFGNTDTESLIFSDSVSVTVVRGGETPETWFHTDGKHADKIHCTNEFGDDIMHMDGDFVFDYVTRLVPGMVKDFQRKHPCDVLIPHQANKSMNRLIESRSGFTGRTMYSIEEYGNQSMNSIPTNIAVNESKLLGKDLLLCGFGAGMSVALMKIRWSSIPVTTILEF